MSLAQHRIRSHCIKCQTSLKNTHTDMRKREREQKREMGELEQEDWETMTPVGGTPLEKI